MTGERHLGGLTPAQWDELAGDRFYSSSAWVTYCARSGGRDRVGACVADLPDGTHAAVPYTRATGAVPPPYRWNDILRGRRLPPTAPDGVVVGVLQGYQTHFLLPPSAHRPQAVTRLVDEVRNVVSPGQTAVAMYLTSPDVRAAREAGVAAPAVLLDLEAWLEVPAGGWPAWLAGLPGKRRREVARERRMFMKAGYAVRHLPLSECYSRLGPLARATEAKYGNETDPVLYTALLKAQARWMGAAARVALLVRADEVVGFCVYYIHQGTLFLRWAGFDYDRLAGAAEYFNLLYYDQIERAPATGVRRIHAGTASLRAKALRGATLSPLWLLDLADDSPLAKAESDVLGHNAAALRRWHEDPVLARAIVSDPGERISECA